jgi:hypothetical protein
LVADLAEMATKQMQMELTARLIVITTPRAPLPTGTATSLIQTKDQDHVEREKKARAQVGAALDGDRNVAF